MNRVATLLMAVPRHLRLEARVHEYEDENGIKVRSEVRLPDGRHYPPWLHLYRMWNWGRGAWIVECEICSKWTGKKKDRHILARFLRTHRRCGFLRGIN